MFLLRLLPLLCLAAGEKWPALKTTWGLNLFGSAFHDRPRTQAEAEAEGWKLLGSCDGQFLGHRFGDPSDPSLNLIYDDAGYIAGVQSGLLVKDVDDKYYPYSTTPVYQAADWFGEPAYFTTAYFVDPEIICNGGRSPSDFATHGTGDRLIFQTGATPDSLVVLPLTQEEADANPDWYDHKCFVGMGDHYFQFDYTPDQDCNTVFPAQVLFDQGVLNGFVWQHTANLPGDKWEHPDALAISAIVESAPDCLGPLIEEPGLSTMHHYFYSYPMFTLCPLKYNRSRQGYQKLMTQK